MKTRYSNKMLKAARYSIKREPTKPKTGKQHLAELLDVTELIERLEALLRELNEGKEEACNV